MISIARLQSRKKTLLLDIKELEINKKNQNKILDDQEDIINENYDKIKNIKTFDDFLHVIINEKDFCNITGGMSVVTGEFKPYRYKLKSPSEILRVVQERYETLEDNLSKTIDKLQDAYTLIANMKVKK